MACPPPCSARWMARCSCRSSAGSARSTSRRPQRSPSTKHDVRSGPPMADLTVRRITDDDIADYLRCMGTGFHFGREVTEERVEFMRTHHTSTLRYGAFADGALAGTTGAFLTALTVPGGGSVPCSAVTQVTVLPTHRRRGLLTEMMTVQLADAV